MSSSGYGHAPDTPDLCGDRSPPQPSPRAVLRGEESPRTRLFEGNFNKTFGRIVPPPSREQAAAWKETLMLPTDASAGASGGAVVAWRGEQLMAARARARSGKRGGEGVGARALRTRGGLSASPPPVAPASP